MPKNGEFSLDEAELVQEYVETANAPSDGEALQVRLRCGLSVDGGIIQEGASITLTPGMTIERPSDRGRMFRVQPFFPTDIVRLMGLKLWSIDEGFATMLTGMIEALQPKMVLEVGTSWGRSARAIAEGLHRNNDGTLITVDMIDFEIHKSGALLDHHKPRVKQVIGKTPGVYEEEAILRNLQGIDLAFLDGEHVEKGLREDLAFVEEHRADECVVIVDNTRDAMWPELEAFFDSYTDHPCINLPTMCGTAMIHMKD